MKSAEYVKNFIDPIAKRVLKELGAANALGVHPPCGTRYTKVESDNHNIIIHIECECGGVCKQIVIPIVELVKKEEHRENNSYAST